MPANGQPAAKSFWSYLSADSGPVNNDVFSSQNLDQQGLVINTAGPSDTATAESKTTSTVSKSLIDSYASSDEKNILHKYRSWTYNFTLGALSKAALSDPKQLPIDIKKYTVLDSAGKGTKGVVSPAAPSATVLANANIDIQDQQDQDIADAAVKKIINNALDSTLVETYNKNSPGRFDMFIDNVKIQTIAAAGSPKSGPAVATNISFDVFEPYSMNGFMEALQVTAKAAGWTDYITGVYALRVQFQGYDASKGLDASPEIIPNTTRYFIVKFTQVHIDVTQDGTRYQVEAVPQNQLGFGMSNILTADVKVVGKTVGEVLGNFAAALNKMAIDEASARKVNKKHNTYQISAPKLSTVGSPQDTKAAIVYGAANDAVHSDMIKAVMNDDLKSPNIFKPVDPAQFKNGGYIGTRQYGADGQKLQGTTSTTTTTKVDPNAKAPKADQVVAFAAGSLIHECIAAVVRESDYTRSLFKEKLDKAKESTKLLTYFNIRLENENLEFDEDDNKFSQNYRYVLEPYQVHFTEVPGQEQGTHDVGPIRSKIKRTYNYIYAGNNEDVLKFQLKFDNLYFAAASAKGGNPSSENPVAASAGADNLTNTKQQASKTNDKQEGANSMPTAPRGVDPESSRGITDTEAGQNLGDPYARMAKAFHDKVMGNADMLQGTLEILGDPYFLTTGGMGNNNLVLAEQYLTAPGPNNTGKEAPTTQGSLFIDINFRNPVDIGTDGMMQFNENLSFSGIYRIITLGNTFKDGQFTQSLEIIRVPGQIVNKKAPERLAPNFKTSPEKGQQVTKDTAAATVLRAGIRPSDFNLANLLSRGLPNIGLPGIPSNFTNAISGAVGAATGAVSNLLNQVGGATGISSALSNQLGVSPVDGVNALTSGIRLSASGLGGLTAVPNAAAAALTAAGKQVSSIGNIPNAAANLATNVQNSISAIPGAVVASANNLTQSVTGLVNNAEATVGNLVGGIGDKITALQNTIPTDLSAVGSKLGLDPSVFSGLGSSLASKLSDELTAVANLVPTNVNLGDLVNQGVSFASITGDKLKNLPAVQPKDVAPAAIPDPSIASIAEGNGSVGTLLGGTINLPDLTDINKIVNPMGGASAAITSGLGNAQAITGAVDAAQNYSNQVIADAAGVVNGVGSLAQNAVAGVMPAGINLGSVESNMANIAALTQNPTAITDKLQTSVAAQFGSLQQSPLAKLVTNSNIQGSV
jgi:hypothetical protein